MVWAVKPGWCYSSWLNFMWHNKRWPQIRLLNGFIDLKQRLTVQFPHPLLPPKPFALDKTENTFSPEQQTPASSFKHVCPQRMIPYVSDSFTINSPKCYFDVQEALLRLSHESFFLETGSQALPKRQTQNTREEFELSLKHWAFNGWANAKIGQEQRFIFTCKPSPVFRDY